MRPVPLPTLSLDEARARLADPLLQSRARDARARIPAPRPLPPEVLEPVLSRVRKMTARSRLEHRARRAILLLGLIGVPLGAPLYFLWGQVPPGAPLNAVAGVNIKAVEMGKPDADLPRSASVRLAADQPFIVEIALRPRPPAAAWPGSPLAARAFVSRDGHIEVAAEALQPRSSSGRGGSFIIRQPGGLLLTERMLRPDDTLYVVVGRSGAIPETAGALAEALKYVDITQPPERRTWQYVQVDITK